MIMNIENCEGVQYLGCLDTYFTVYEITMSHYAESY